MYLEGFEAILIFSLKTILFKVLAKNKGGGGNFADTSATNRFFIDAFSNRIKQYDDLDTAIYFNLFESIVVRGSIN